MAGIGKTIACHYFYPRPLRGVMNLAPTYKVLLTILHAAKLRSFIDVHLQKGI